MKRKIFLSMCYIAAISVLLTVFFLSFVHYRDDYNRLTESTRNKAKYIASADMNITEEYLSKLNEISPSRITWVGADGTILYANYESQVKNYSDFPEFKNALKYGYGENIRISDLTDKETFYYANLLNDGTVIVTSDETISFLKELTSSLPYLIIVIGATLIVVGIISNIQTEKIVKPINEINLDYPQENLTYEELSPLLRRIEKQNYDINKYIKTLKNKQNEFETVTQNMNEGLIILHDRNILTCNQSALKILGSENYNYTGISIYDLTDSEIFIKSVETALSGKTNEVNLPSENKNYMVISSPVFSKSKVTGVVILLIDSTEKISREELRREFSANVSHELKTPLTTISGYAEIMKEGWVQTRDYPEFSNKIYNEAKRMIALIDDIINLSKLDENQKEMEKEPVDLYLMSKDVAESLAEKANKKTVSICTKGENVDILAVPHLLYEMIYNLIDNAIKYNKADGNVYVNIIHNNNKVKLVVEDTGIGIPVEDIERVFERFYCVDKSHSKETGGTGLGLSIVKHGAQLHNAKLNIESTLGIGTKISLTFDEI